MGVVESDRGLDVEPAHRIDPDAELTTEVVDGPRVEAGADLSAGVENGGRCDTKVEGDDLVESEGCTRRSAKDTACADGAVRIPLTDSIEEVARPDEAAQIEAEVIGRECLELGVDHTVRCDQGRRSGDAEQMKPSAEVEAQMPVALVHHRSGCTVALTAADELESSTFRQRRPLLVGLAAIGCPTSVLTRTECVEVVAKRTEAGAERVDLRGVDQHRVETGAEFTPLGGLLTHTVFSAGVLEMIEAPEDVGEIDFTTCLGHANRGRVSDVDAPDDA